MTQLESWLDDHAARRRAERALLASIGITIALYLIPFAVIVKYPLMLLSTVVHELGHAFAAVLLGSDFQTLSVFADGSGVAKHIADPPLGPAGNAFVAAGGLVGPAVAAAIGFVVGRYARGARAVLALAAAFLLVVDILFVRNTFGMLFIGGLVIGIGWVAVRSTTATAQIVLVFLATQLALSIFSRGDYLFTEMAETGEGRLPSDVSIMASSLGGPYWMWGLVCGGFSVLVLVGGVWWFIRSLHPARAKKRPRSRFAR